MRFLIVFGLVFLAGCAKPAIRDATVYKAEIDFIDAAAKEVVDNGKAVIAASCECIEPVEGVKVFSTPECDRLAETVLVMESRMGYHTSFMRYLGGISDVRPDKEAPEVPAVGTLCKESE